MKFTPDPQRVAVIVVALCLTTASCGFGLARRGAPTDAEPEATISYGADTEFDPAEDRIKVTENGTGPGTLRIRLVDSENRTVAGAFLRYRGPSKGKRATNARGVISVRVKPGTYTIKLLRCGRTVVIDDTAEARAVVGAGGVVKGRLSVQADRVKRRYEPSNSALATTEAPWPRGQKIKVGVRIQDGCRPIDAVQGIDVSSFGWRSSENIAIHATPSKTAADGFAYATISCTDEGNATLVIYDPNDPSTEIDLLSAMPYPPFGDWCA